MAAGRPITDAERTRLAELHAQGLSRNEIARDLGRAQSTVSKLAAEAGLSFDRARTRAATEAKMLDAKARRAQLAVDLLADAERMRLQLWAPTTIYNFGGKENTYNERPVDQPPFRDQRDIVHAVGLLVDKHVRLTEVDADLQGLPAVDAWLRNIVGE